jgi:hypothetical protein
MKTLGALLLVVVASGCGGTGDGAPDTNHCNNLPLTESSMLPSYVKGNPPQFTGGAIVDGTYALTNATIYNPTGLVGLVRPIGAMYRFSAGKVDFLDYDGTVNRTFSGTFTTSGNGLTIAVTCGGDSPYTQSYSATASTITLGQEGGTVGPVLTLTKQ